MTPRKRLGALDEIAETGRKGFGIEELGRNRINVAEIIDVVAEGRSQLVKLRIARAVADQHLEAQSALARLAQEQRDVWIVSSMENDIGAGTLELGDQRREIGRARE